MSIGDHVRYLRAAKGGPTPWDIQQATGIPSSTLSQLEQRYRAVGTDEELAKLAEYFGVPVEDLLQRQDWTRKALSAFLAEAYEEDWQIKLRLRNGQEFNGRVLWYDLGATLLQLDDGQEVVIQRHFVDRWEPA